MIEREFPEVNLIRNKNNRGLAAANNQGLEKSKGRYLLTLNSDTLILRGIFDKLVHFMNDHPDAGGATPKLLLPDGSLHPNIIGERPTLRAELLSVLCHTPLANKLKGLLLTARYGKWTDYSRTCEVPFILWGTCFIVRREVLDEVGLQDPRFFIYYEDWDWAMRIVKRGWKLYYIADAEIIHYGGQSTKQSGSRMKAQQWNSRCRGLQKHSGLMAGLILRAVIILIFGMKILKLLILGTCQPSGRLMAKTSIRQMQEIIRAVLTY
jgi:GT2 family glycosyltransferase